MKERSFQPLRIGLTGGIGSGKSTVVKQLQSYGVPVICADQVAHDLTAPQGQAIAPIVAAFGSVAIQDGALNRAYMRQLIFHDVTAKTRLEAILHPLIQAQMMGLYVSYQAAYVVFDIPLLVESWQRYQTIIERVCVVDCDKTTQIKRVLQRNQWDQATVEKIIAQQATPAQRALIANDHIDNTAHMTLGGLQQQVEQLHQQWLVLAQRRNGS